MEIALLADGVAPDKLYPLDQSRALAALKRIRSQVVAWWTSGVQVTQLLRDGEADMVQIWGSRVPPLIRDGAPVAYTYNGALLTYSCMAIPKGARHAAAAQRLLARIVHGFRSMFSNWVAEYTKYPDSLAEEDLAHIIASQAVAAYRRRDQLERRRRMMETLGAYCTGQRAHDAPVTSALPQTLAV